jgi:hypothetical protein
MPLISARTTSFSESVIRRMTRIANKSGAVNLSQGFPDFDPPERLLDALQQVAFSGPHQYAVTWGAPDFRDALARKQQRFMGILRFVNGWPEISVWQRYRDQVFFVKKQITLYGFISQRKMKHCLKPERG